jgi:hypothetical protein
VVKVIQLALRLYDKYSKVNVDKLYHRLNEQLATQQEQDVQGRIDKKEKERKEGKGWTYGTMMQRTSDFLGRLRLTGSKK